MANKFKSDDGFEFETEDEELPKQRAKTQEKEDIDVEDDTPEADRGRDPMPADIIKALEEDDLESYDKSVKTKLKQFKKVWHDERREKERFQRENDAAITTARKLLEENKKLKQTLTDGTKEYVETYKSAAELEAEAARKDYKEAYDSGDADKVLAAQEKLNGALFKLQAAKNYKGPLQVEKNNVESSEEVQKPSIDRNTLAWQERNKWYGTDPEMTGLAFGQHQKLLAEHGKSFVGTDAYWEAIDAHGFPTFTSFGREVARVWLSKGGHPYPVVCVARLLFDFRHHGGGFP